MDELKKLMAEATPGPWYFHDLRAQKEWEGEQSYSISVGLYFVDDAKYYPSSPNFADAALIVAAVNALPELLAKVKRLEADLQVIAFGWRYVAEPDNSFTKVDWTRDQLIEYARTALNQETGSFTDDPFNRAVLGLPLKETGQ